MIKSLVLASVLTAFAGASFAQASAPMSADKPMAAASGSMGNHKAHKAKKAHAPTDAASGSMK